MMSITSFLVMLIYESDPEKKSYSQTLENRAPPTK